MLALSVAAMLRMVAEVEQGDGLRKRCRGS